MTRYAEGTTVSADRSRVELERTLRRFGADQFATGWDEATGQQAVAFRMAGRQIRLELQLPDLDDPEFRLTPTGKGRATSAAREAYERESRRRWREFAAGDQGEAYRRRGRHLDVGAPVHDEYGTPSRPERGKQTR